MQFHLPALVAQTVKKAPASAGDGVQSPGQEGPLEKEMPLTPVFSPGESHRQREPSGLQSMSHRESDMTESLTLFPLCGLSRFFNLTKFQFSYLQNGKSNSYL